MKLNLIVGILLYFLISLPSASSDEEQQLECENFWISKNIEWKHAYDDVLFTEGNLIFNYNDSLWGKIVAGTLTKVGDTISVNQEGGIQNICFNIKPKPSQNVLLHGNKTFIKASSTIRNGCWCNWSNQPSKLKTVSSIPLENKK
ncbi:hypothetical protein OAA91_01890 [Fibrobacterales bacterium]|nr:hypothetical protein [Fibrobacterales bacterium]